MANLTLGKITCPASNKCLGCAIILYNDIFSKTD